MTRVVLLLMISLAACGGGGPATVDAAPDGEMCRVPTGFTFAAIGDRSFASFGAAGTLHDVRVPDGTPFGVDVKTCDGCDGVCSFEGPTPPSSPVDRRRCLNRMSRTCTQDSECPDDGTPYRRCVFIYDAPAGTPLIGAGGKRGACGWSYIPIAPADMPPTVQGTLDLASGELNISSLTILLPLNGQGGTYRGACAECIGDDIANDGVKNGRCALTTRGEAADPSLDIGQPCDIHRYGNTPGFEGNYSMDCSPTVRANDGQPNVFGGLFTSSGYQISVTASSPDCTDPSFAGEKCFCGMCPDGVTQCLNNAECGGAQCGYLPPNCNPNPYPFDDNGMSNLDPSSPTMPTEARFFDPRFAPTQCRGQGSQTFVTTSGNSCRNGVCNWNADTGLGSCISKLTNAPVGCYPTGLGATVAAVGGARKVGNVFIADTATARCNRFTPSPLTNAQLGLPGLTFQKRSFRIIPEYDE